MAKAYVNYSRLSNQYEQDMENTFTSTPPEQEGGFEAFQKRINSPAIQTPDGNVVEGKFHDDIRDKNPEATQQGSKAGFTTDSNKFVDRIEAAKIAKKSGQIKNKNIKNLHSEDLSNP